MGYKVWMLKKWRMIFMKDVDLPIYIQQILEEVTSPKTKGELNRVCFPRMLPMVSFLRKIGNTTENVEGINLSMVGFSPR